MNLQNELFRKSLHLLLILIPITYFFLGKWTSLMIFFPLSAFIIGLDYSRRKSTKIKIIFNKIFGKILREHELSGDKFCGASFVAMATCINFLLFKAEIAITAFMIFIVCDALSAIVGKNFPSQPFFEKSFFGSLAFFVSGIIILFICGAIFDCKIWFYLFGFFATFCVTVIEARPSLLKIDDNFTIPIIFSSIMTFFDLIWNYNY